MRFSNFVFSFDEFPEVDVLFGYRLEKAGVIQGLSLVLAAFW